MRERSRQRERESRDENNSKALIVSVHIAKFSNGSRKGILIK